MNILVHVFQLIRVFISVGYIIRAVFAGSWVHIRSVITGKDFSTVILSVSLLPAVWASQFHILIRDIIIYRVCNSGGCVVVVD